MTESQPSPSEQPSTAAAKPTLSQRVFRRTTDLLAIAILLIGGLMVGGRLSEWWSTDPSEIPSPMEVAQHESGTPGSWGEQGSPVTLEFGAFSQALRRQELKGTAEEITNQLTAWCRNTVQQSDPPTEPPKPEETRLLQQLKTLKAIEKLPRRGTVYRTDYPVTLVLGTRALEETESRNPKEAEHPPERVVCWGFAFPRTPGVWTLFLSGPGKAARQLSPLPEIELPPSCRRLMSLRNDFGDGLAAFAGETTLEKALAHFDVWFATSGWTVGRTWSEVGGRWSARFVSPQSDGPVAGWLGMVDVELGEAGGQLSGVLNFLPRTRSLTE